MGGELRVRNGSIGLHVKYVVDQKWVILSGLKRAQVNRVAGWIRLTCIFHMIFFFFKYKKNNMYLPFEKLCNKLLDVKCIILNSPLLSRRNSIKLIDTY